VVCAQAMSVMDDHVAVPSLGEQQLACSAERSSPAAPSRRKSSCRAQEDQGGLLACPDGLDAALDERLDARAVE